MSPPTSVRPPRPEHVAPLIRRIGLRHVLVALVAVAMLVPLSRLLAVPRFVERISFENPTEYHLKIDTTDGEREEWTTVGTAHRNGISAVEEVPDMGEVWRFRFISQGQQGGELRLTRQELVRHGWRVRIPSRIGHELQAKGAPLPP